MVRSIFFTNVASGVLFALLGHTIGYWAYDLHYTLSTVTLLGSVFSAPSLLRAPLCICISWVFRTSKRLIVCLALARWAFMCRMTHVVFASYEFCVLGVLAASVGTIFDGLMIGQVRAWSKDSDLPRVSKYTYIGYIAGMIVGSNVALVMSKYLAWHTVYRVLAATAMLVNICSLVLLPAVTEQCMSIQRATAKLFTHITTHAAMLTVLTLLWKLQNAFLAQSITLFLMRRMGKEVTAFVKAASHAAMFVGMCAPMVETPTRFMVAKTLVVLGLLVSSWHLESVHILVLAALLWLEKFLRACESVTFSRIQMQYTDKKHATVQLTLISAVVEGTRLVGDAVSGACISALGWHDFFGMVSVLSIVVTCLAVKVFSYDTR